MRLRRAAFAGENAQRELNREMRGGAGAVTCYKNVEARKG
jgi:hypothetical protein